MFELIENTQSSRKGSFGGSLILHAVVIVILSTVVPALTSQLPANRTDQVTLIVPAEPLYLYPPPVVKVPIVQEERAPAPTRLARRETAPTKPAVPEKPIEPPKAERAEAQPVFKPATVATDKRLLVETAGTTVAPVVNQFPSVPVPTLRTETKIDRPIEPAVVGLFEVSKPPSRNSAGNGSVEMGGFGGGPRNGSGLGTSLKPDSRGGGVADAGFGEARVATAKPPSMKVEPAPDETPAEIISKPRPQYTEEARQLKIQGAVLLRVIFTAQGEVRVLETVRGLGHGLDENAIQVARQIRFKPALRNGIAVDSRAIVQIVFQLAY